MKKNNNVTKKQHYIPQVYLRGFSPEYEKGNVDYPLSKYSIYCYDLTGKDQIKKAVPIKSVCYSDYLYEVTGHEGEIVLTNYLEHFFAGIEKMFSEYRHELEKKAFIESNYKTKCFLTSKEKIFWVTYILVQILRTPQILNMAEDVSLETWKNQINSKQAKNIARMFCLPFFKELEEGSQEVYIFNALFEPMKNMSFGVGVDRQARIITSDKPIYIHSEEFPCEEYGRVIFPISAELCLFLFGREDKKHYPKNFLFPIDDETREEIIKSLTASSFEKIYSNHMLDKKERRFIREVLMEKEER